MTLLRKWLKSFHVCGPLGPPEKGRVAVCRCGATWRVKSFTPTVIGHDPLLRIEVSNGLIWSRDPS